MRAVTYNDHSGGVIELRSGTKEVDVKETGSTVSVCDLGRGVSFLAGD